MNRRALEEMNQMLFEVVQTGTGQRGDLDPRPAAAKTGTSQEWRDAWFIGYTADFVTGVWMGNDDSTPMTRVVGGSLPASVWKAYMLAAHRNIAVHTLPGIDVFGGPSYADASPEDGDEPWVERGDDPYERPARRGVIEDFFDSLFGDDDTALPPPPPPAPRFVPQSTPPEFDDDEATDAEEDVAAADEEAPEEAAAEAARAEEEREARRLARRERDRRRAPPPESDGPYRQPEPDPSEPSPF
jgi:membrane peptidoglycan carboxypeptidase